MWHVTYRGMDVSNAQRFITLPGHEGRLALPVKESADVYPLPEALVRTRVVERVVTDGVVTWRCSCRTTTIYKWFCRHIYNAWFFGAPSGGGPDVGELLLLVDQRWLRVTMAELVERYGNGRASMPPPTHITVVGRTGSWRRKVPRGTTVFMYPAAGAGAGASDPEPAQEVQALSAQWRSLEAAFRSPGLPNGQSGRRLVMQVGAGRTLEAYLYP